MRSVPLVIVPVAFLLGLSVVPVLRAPSGQEARSRSCTYSTYAWHAEAHRAVDRREVTHAYSELRPDEIDLQTGCTVCEEDQVELRLGALAPFRVCRRIVSDVERALTMAQARGASILSVTGYRVGLTRGAVDGSGRRTGFSNHSFGTALDINEAHNGLYDRCETFGPRCRLLRGGAWSPGDGASLTAASPITQELGAVGLRWGGAIAGRQKDFMHFSPTGY